MKIVVFLLALIYTNILFTQDLDLKWSEKMKYQDDLDGLFSSYIDANDKYIYSLYINNLNKTATGIISKMKIVAFDKNTLIKTTSIAIEGFDDPKGKMAEDLTYYKTIVQNDLIYVFWTKINKLDEEIYVETFDSNLKRMKEFTKIATLDLPVDMKKSVLTKKSSSFVVLSHKKQVNSIIVGCEVPKKNNYLKFRYFILDENLKLSVQKEVTFPVKLNDTYYGILGPYTCLENGDIITYSTFTAEKDKGNSDRVVNREIKLSKLNLLGNLTYIKIAEGKCVSVELPYKSKYAPKQNYLLTKDNKFQFYGMYSDLNRDPKGDAMHGIFLYELNTLTLEQKELELIPFEKSVTDKIYGIAENPKSYKTSSVSMDSVFLTDKGESIFRFSLFSTNPNPAVTLSNNTTSFVKMNGEHKVIWANYFDRPQSYYNNLIILERADELLMAYQTLSSAKKIMYRIINTSTGKFTDSKEFVINNTDENLEIMTNISRKFDNKIYINYTNFKKEEGSIGVISW